MGGGGFMKHAVDTNKKDKEQKFKRREKFNANHGEKTVLGAASHTTMDFTHLSKEQIEKERKRIQSIFAKRRKRNILTVLLSISIAGYLVIWLIQKLNVALIH